MPIVNADFTKRSTRGPIVPDGNHLCEIVQIVEAKSSRQGNPQLQVTLEVAEGAFKGGKITDYIPLNDNAMFRRVNLFWAAGLEGESDSSVDTDQITRLSDTGEALSEQGALLMVNKTTKVEQYEGKDVNRINLNYSRADEEPAGEAPKPAVTAAPAKVVRRAVRT